MFLGIPSIAVGTDFSWPQGDYLFYLMLVPPVSILFPALVDGLLPIGVDRDAPYHKWFRYAPHLPQSVRLVFWAIVVAGMAYPFAVGALVASVIPDSEGTQVLRYMELRVEGFLLFMTLTLLWSLTPSLFFASTVVRVLTVQSVRWTYLNARMSRILMLVGMTTGLLTSTLPSLVRFWRYFRGLEVTYIGIGGVFGVLVGLLSGVAVAGILLRKLGRALPGGEVAEAKTDNAQTLPEE
jgi:hypothetical protein